MTEQSKEADSAKDKKPKVEAKPAATESADEKKRPSLEEIRKSRNTYGNNGAFGGGKIGGANSRGKGGFSGGRSGSAARGR